MLGEAFEHAFHRELRLVGTEPAERAAHRVVGPDRHGFHVDVADEVRAGGVAGGSFEHLHADRCIRARVADHPHLDRGELAVGVAAGVVVHPDRVAFGMHQQRLFTRQCDLHGCADVPRRQRRVRLVRHVFLAAERAAVGDQLGRDAVGVDAEHRGDVVAVVPDALATGVHVQTLLVTFAGRDRERRLGLEERMLDALRLEGLRDGVCSGGERRIDVTTRVGGGGQRVAVEFPHGRVGAVHDAHRVDHRLVHLVLDVDEFGGGAGDLAGVGDDDGEHVAEVGGASADGDHHRPVLVDDAHSQRGRDVGRGVDGVDAVHVECCGRVDAQDVGASVVGEVQRTVQQAVGAHVVDEVTSADRELAALVLDAARARRRRAARPRERCPGRGLRRRRAP